MCAKWKIGSVARSPIRIRFRFSYLLISAFYFDHFSGTLCVHEVNARRYCSLRADCRYCTLAAALIIGFAGRARVCVHLHAAGVSCRNSARTFGT